MSTFEDERGGNLTLTRRPTLGLDTYRIQLTGRSEVVLYVINTRAPDALAKARRVLGLLAELDDWTRPTKQLWADPDLKARVIDVMKIIESETSARPLTYDFTTLTVTDAEGRVTQMSVEEALVLQEKVRR